MRFRGWAVPAAAALLLAGAGSDLRAQSITLSPLLGVYTQANSVDQLRSNANAMSIERESALALGGNLEIGFLRASLNYVSGATVRQKGTTSF
ncbi:MAG TPA: hypothetical protein VF832_15635, partial [Longimicrobiales bacterium]